MQKLAEKQFVITGAVDCGCIANFGNLIAEIDAIKSFVTAINVVDNPGARINPNPVAVASYLKTHTDVDIIFHQTTRDMNRLGIASTLLGVAALGIQNLVLTTGDHPMLGDLPRSKPVFDLDSTQLLQLAREMVDQHTIYGQPIEGDPTTLPNFHIGIGTNPNSTHPEIERLKIERKIALGVDFIQTQPIFNVEQPAIFLQELQKFNIPILLGLCPPKDYTAAKEIEKKFPSIPVPADLIQKFKKINQSSQSTENKTEAYNQVNLEYFSPILAEMRKKKWIHGVHILTGNYPQFYAGLFRK
jgi:5,10-methylenetetrahydrofolate reductase